MIGDSLSHFGCMNERNSNCLSWPATEQSTFLFVPPLARELSRKTSSYPSLRIVHAFFRKQISQVMLCVISRRCLHTQKRYLLRSSASVHPTASFSLKACATWPSSQRRPLSTTAEAPPPPFPVASSLRLHDATTTKEDALTAWRTRRVIAEARQDPQRLLMLLEMEGMDAYNVVILVSRLAQACEGKMEATAAVQNDPRFAQLVEQVLGGKGGGVVKEMSELQMDSVRASLRLLGVEGA